MTLRVCLLSVVALCAAVAPADAQRLAGRWLTILDINGAVMPHAEELQVTADGAVKTIVYGIRRLPECDTAHFAEAGPCAPARPNISGTIARDVAKGTIAVDHMVPTRGAMEGIGTPFDEQLAAELFWFGPGPPWKLGVDGGSSSGQTLLRATGLRSLANSPQRSSVPT